MTGKSAISSGRTPASTAQTSSPNVAPSAAASRRSASVLPERDGPAMTTREPLPNGVSHSIALTVGSSEPSSMRSAGQATGRSSKRVPSATSSAGRPLIVSTRISDGKRSERRAGAHRAGDAVAGDELAALDLRGGDVDVVVGRLRRREAQEARAVGEQLDRALDRALLAAARLGLRRGRDRLVAVAIGRGVAALVLVAATATAAAPAAARALGPAVVIGRSRRAWRRPRPRPPSTTGSDGLVARLAG